jgi:acyl-ACP thioesterase
MPNRRVFFPRYFIFRNSRGEQIGCAGTLWVVLDVTTRKMANASEIAPLLPDNSDLLAPMGMPATVEEMIGDEMCAARLPMYTDLDMNGHVNNTRYLDWCCNALGIETMRGYAMQHFAVNFNQEILPGQEVRTVLHTAGDAFSFSGFEGEKRHFDVGGTLVKQ